MVSSPFRVKEEFISDELTRIMSALANGGNGVRKKNTSKEKTFVPKIKGRIMQNYPGSVKSAACVSK